MGNGEENSKVCHSFCRSCTNKVYAFEATNGIEKIGAVKSIPLLKVFRVEVPEYHSL